ncbi:MAG: hypothetical protein VB099_03120 [Candidatus Limiplasma sp.]|nr:hypothetical protein [Candidatus Limiplasma sp.]
MAAETAPEWIGKAAVYGQALKPLLSQAEVFEALEKSKLPPRHKARLALLKDPGAARSVEDLLSALRWLRKYT